MTCYYSPTAPPAPANPHPELEGSESTWWAGRAQRPGRLMLGEHTVRGQLLTCRGSPQGRLSLDSRGLSGPRRCHPGSHGEGLGAQLQGALPSTNEPRAQATVVSRHGAASLKRGSLLRSRQAEPASPRGPARDPRRSANRKPSPSFRRLTWEQPPRSKMSLNSDQPCAQPVRITEAPAP